MGRNRYTYEISIDNQDYRFEDIVVRVVKDGRTILSFDGNVKKQEIPEAAEAAKQTRSNPNPASGQVYYDLGLCLFYQGRYSESFDAFYKAVWNADAHIEDDILIDYFAVSLPDLLVFEENLNRKNRLHCLFMKALGLYGLGRLEESRTLFEQALKENNSTFQIATHYQLLFEQEA